MALEEIDDYKFSAPFSESNTDILCYGNMLEDIDFLTDVVKSDPEKVLRYHLIFETEDGEGSKAKCPPILGREFVKNYGQSKDYGSTCDRINKTVIEYYSTHT